MKWNAFIMVRNEEDMVADAISCIKCQTNPPEDIYVMDDGSTDSTNALLDSIDGIILTRGPPHQSEHFTQSYIQKRTKLMYNASVGSDYVLNLDADTYIPPRYIEDITRSMESDGVMVSCGKDVNGYKNILPTESGMTINVRWLNTHKSQLRFDHDLTIQSLLEGYPSVVYRDIQLTYKRKSKINYSRIDRKRKGEQMRKYGVFLPIALYRSIRQRSLLSFLGYVSYRGDVMPEPIRRWYSDYQIQRIKMKLRLDTWMFRETDRGLFILPKIEQKRGVR